MTEYQELKDMLFNRTKRYGGLLAGYLLLAVSAEAAACAFLGMGASLLYLTVLYRDVDAVQPTDKVPMMEAEKIQQPVQRNLTKAGGEKPLGVGPA